MSQEVEKVSLKRYIFLGGLGGFIRDFGGFIGGLGGLIGGFKEV